jgi:cysteine desulfurase/selenocysteine lyase
MDNIEAHEKALAQEAISLLSEIPSFELYGPKNPSERTSLVSFNCAGISPFRLAEALNGFGVESRAGCHCATLAHNYYPHLTPPASCRLSFYIYNDLEDVRKACAAVKNIVESHASSTISDN